MVLKKQLKKCKELSISYPEIMFMLSTIIARNRMYYIALSFSYIIKEICDDKGWEFFEK